MPHREKVYGEILTGLADGARIYGNNGQSSRTYMLKEGQPRKDLAYRVMLALENRRLVRRGPCEGEGVTKRVPWLITKRGRRLAEQIRDGTAGSWLAK